MSYNMFAMPLFQHKELESTNGDSRILPLVTQSMCSATELWPLSAHSHTEIEPDFLLFYAQCAFYFSGKKNPDEIQYYPKNFFQEKYVEDNELCNSNQCSLPLKGTILLL